MSMEALRREVDDLDLVYVRSVGKTLRTALLAGRACSLDYQPGNMTRYEMLGVREADAVAIIALLSFIADDNKVLFGTSE